LILKEKKLNIIILLGLVAIIGILIAQLLWTRQAFTLEEKKFSQKAHIALLEVAKQLYAGTNNLLPSENPVQKISNDYYIVNVNNDFEPEVLEFYLKSEFAKATLNTDFEYAMYNCQSDEMVYGNYISKLDSKPRSANIYFPKHKNLVYYFAVRFPNESSFLFSSLKFWFILSGALLLILLVYSYSIFIILQQKRYSELQRDFINNMTHEFKTPLSSILIASNFLSNQKQIQTNEKLSNYTRIIIDQSKKLNSHIEKILTIAKADNAPLQLDKTVVNVSTQIQEVIDTILLKYPNCELSLECNKDFRIEADVFHFNNIVFNLLDNSVKYCAQTPKINVLVSNENQHLKLQFIDNGIGIPVGKIKDIFDKFYRIPNQKSNEVTGFGLGLYYVKKIIDLHHWKIAVENNLQIGITTTIQIPNK
jgi:two-component system, OmpR family, phosphate regulon sensor histidine kinase PhoR